LTFLGSTSIDHLGGNANMPKILLILDYRISAVIEVINPDSGLQRRLSSSGDLSEL